MAQVQSLVRGLKFHKLHSIGEKFCINLKGERI